MTSDPTRLDDALDDGNTAVDSALAVSRTQVRLQSKALQRTLDALVARLCALAPKRLVTLDLEEEVVRGVELLRTMKNGGGLARQRRGVARRLRAADLGELSDKLDAIDSGSSVAGAPITEQHDAPIDGSPRWWTAELLQCGDVCLATLLSMHPTADRQGVRRALRAATAEKRRAKGERHQKELLRVVTVLLQQHAGG